MYCRIIFFNTFLPLLLFQPKAPARHARNASPSDAGRKCYIVAGGDYPADDILLPQFFFINSSLLINFLIIL